MIKVCKSCNKTDKIYKIHNKDLDKSEDWPILKEKINIFKNNPKLELNNIKLTKNSNNKIKIKLPKSISNRYVFYYAAEPKRSKILKYYNSNRAYGSFKNSGIGKVDSKVGLSVYIECPQNYMENGLWYPHIHFLVSDKNNKYWKRSIYTQIVLCHINKSNVVHAIHKNKSLILNALPIEEYIKDRVPTSHSLPYNSIKKLSDKVIVNYIINMAKNNINLKHYIKNNIENILNIPIITYCYNEKCNASNILIERLWKCGFKNIKEFSGGIVEWNKS